MEELMNFRNWNSPYMAGLRGLVYSPTRFAHNECNDVFSKINLINNSSYRDSVNSFILLKKMGMDEDLWYSCDPYFHSGIIGDIYNRIKHLYLLQIYWKVVNNRGLS